MAKKVDSIIRSMKKNGYTEPEVADDWEDRFEYDYKGVSKEDRLDRLQKLTESADASYAAYKAQQAQNEADKATGLYQYNHATDDQKSALDNIYTAQHTKPTGYERFTGTAQNATKMANDFKTTYGVDDDAYNTLMKGYKAYRSGQAANALASYNDISDEQKKALEKIRSLKTDGTANNTTMSGGDRYSGYKTDKRNAAGTIAQNFVNSISGKTAENNAEASRLKEEFKQKYGVDDSTYSAWQAKYDEDQTAREEEAAAHKEGVRTQSQEMEYANKAFKNFTSKDTGDGSSWNDRTNALKQEIYDYLDQEDATQTSEAMQYAESASNVNSTLQKQKLQLERTKASIKSKYNLSDEDFEDLKYYGQELYDADNRKKQQQEAYDNVHTGSTLKNVVGGIKNTATALVTNPYGGLGAIGETLKYNHGGYRDNQSPINVNSNAFAATNATSDYQSATQQAINDKNKALGILYGAGMSAAESAETGILAGGTNNRALASALSLAPFAANAYGNSLSENVSNDQRQSKAFENALTSATIETVTEIASADKFWDIFKNHNATARKRIIDFLVSSGIEGTEEVVGDIADNFMDAVVNGQNSDYNKNVRSYMMSGMSEEEAKEQATKDSVANTAESFVSGALSGAMGAGIATAAGYANDVTTANNLFDNYTSEDYAQWAEGLDTDPASYKNESVAQSAQKAKELATKMSEEETPSKKEKLQLYEYYQDIVDTENAALAEEQEKTSKQEKWNGLKDKVKNTLGLNKSNEQTNTKEAEQATDSSQRSSGAENHSLAETHTTYNDAYKAIQSATTQEELNDAVQDAKASTEISEEDYARLRETAVSYAASKNNLDMEVAEVSTEDAYNEGYQNPNAENPYTNVNSKNAIAFNEAQQTAKQDTQERESRETASVAEKAKLQFSSVARDFMTSRYNPSINSSIYSDTIGAALTAGRTGADINEVVMSNAGVAMVGEDLVRQAYSIGAQIEAADMIKESKISEGMTKGVTFGTGTFYDLRADKESTINGLSTVKAIAKATGLNIVLTDDAKMVNSNENGYYVPSKSTIYLNADRADKLAGTVLHEVGEFASTWNQKEQASVVNAILNAAQKELGSVEFNKIRNQYAAQYAAVEENKSDADLDKELANDLLFKFLGTEEGMTKLINEIDSTNSFEEAKSIKQKIADWLDNLVESIRNFLQNFAPNEYQRKIAEANLDHMYEIQIALVKSIANATKNYNEAREQAQTIKEGNGTIEDYGVELADGEKRLSITTYENGGRAYLEKYLNEMADDLTKDQRDDIIEQMDMAYKLAKDLSRDGSYKFFSDWSQADLVKSVDGTPLIEIISNTTGKPIQSVAVSNGEYPLNIDFSQVCKKRSTLNAVLNYLIDEYGLNLPTLTETDINAINQTIKQEGFEIACGLCFVDAKRYRVGKWASSFAEGEYNKEGKLKSEKPGFNNLVRSIKAKDKTADVGYSYFNFATNIPNTSEKTIDQLDDSELDFSKLIKKMGKFAQKDENGNVTGLKGYVEKSGKRKNPTALAKMAYAIYTDRSLRQLVAEEDLISSEGLDNMRAKNGALYNLVNSHWGAGKPKLSHGGTAYGNEIIRSATWGAKNNFDPASAYKVGGVRVQSFSDYEANMFFDYMQMFADMTARALPSHAYTKEVAYARIFGMTGQKINLSVVAKAAELTPEQQKRYNKLVNKGGRKALLEDAEFKEIAENAGLGKDENGNYTRLLVEDETFPLAEALEIQNDERYADNCGIIWIGVSHNQIMRLLDDENVPMVIPYHSSGVSAFIKKARNLTLYEDYTDKQNTRNKSDGKKISGKDFDFYESLGRTNDPATTAEEYKEWCEENDYLPKFDEFADHSNYYKLLTDFRVYDYNGIDPKKVANRRYLPQGAVSMTFPENIVDDKGTTEFKKLVMDSLADQQKTKDKLYSGLTHEQGSLISKIADAIGLDANGNRTTGEATKRRSVDVEVTTDSDSNTLTSAQQEFFSDSKVRDEDGRLKVMYHGSTNAGFTTFYSNYSDDGTSFFFTDKPSVAKSYSGTDAKYEPDKKYSFSELSEMVNDYFAGDIELVKNGSTIGLVDVDGEVIYEGTLNGARDAFFDRISDYSHDRGEANYTVYLNLENPLEIDAKGARWNNLFMPDEKPAHSFDSVYMKYDSSTHKYTMRARGKENLFINSLTLDEIVEQYGENVANYVAAGDYFRATGSVLSASEKDVYFDEDWNRVNADATTRDIAQYAKNNGYDGVIFKNIIDIGINGDIDEASTVAVAFSSEQIKLVNNENPTQAEDIRRALGYDEELDFFASWSPEDTQTKSGLMEALQSGNEILKDAKVNKADVRRIARQIKQQYGSNIEVNELADNLEKIFAYAQKQDYINYDDLATVIAEVAAPVIDGSVNKVGANEFKAFKNALQSYTFNLDEKQVKEVISVYGSWGAFRKALPGIKFTRDGSGTSLDGVWDSLVRESGYVLEQSVTSNDMPIALVDAFNAMKPTYENAFGEDAQKATQDAAMEIVSKYYKYAAEQEKSELKAQQRQRLIDQSNMLKKRNEETRKKLQQQYKERLEKEVSKLKQEGKPEKVSVQVARLRARQAKTVASLRENQKRKEKLKVLNKVAGNMINDLVNPTDKHHIPAVGQNVVMQLVSAVDAVPETVRETADGKYSIRIIKSRHTNADGSYSYEWMTIKADTVQDAVAQYKEAMAKYGYGSASARQWQDNLEAVHELYTQPEEDDWYERSELKGALDKNLGDQLGQILANNKGMMSIAQLSSDELQTIIDVFYNVRHAVNQINRMYTMPSQQVTDVAHKVMNRAYNQKAKGRKAHGKMGNTILDTFTLDHATPETFFHGLFGGKETDPVTKIMLKAQNQKARDIRQAQEYMAEYMTDDVKNAVKGWMYDARSRDHNTRNFYGLELTTTQVMSLYELMKREDAQQHKVGGFVADETGRKSDGRHNVIHLTDEQIKTITDTLSEEQKKIADAMQSYMANQCAEQGNETAMQLYGYEKYLDEHYFPMATDKNTIATRDSNVTTGAVNAIKNSGFTKAITPNANNPLVLKDIFTVFSDHVSDMATYHSWAAPLQDILRFYNFNEKDNVEKGGQFFIERKSTKDAFDYFYGKKGQEYMTRLLSSINQMEKSNLVGGDFIQMMTGNAKSAAVMGNIRVVVQQPTAFFRAGEMISYRYLNDGFAGKYAKEAAELRDRTSDVFWLKNQGNIDGYITQSMTSTITGVQTAKEKINEKAGSLAGKADEVTWAAMYRAVYAEQVDKLGKSKIGTEEFENAVNDRFSEIMLRTQVYDGTITRSQFMRSTDWYNKMASAFMAEPVKTYNIVLRHAIDLMQADNPKAVAEAKKSFVRAAGVLTLTNAANAVVQSLWDAFRNAGDADDEDKDFLQRFLDALGLGFLLDENADVASSVMGGNFVDNMDLLGNIPLVADYWDAIKTGFSSAVLGESSYSSDSDLSMSAVNNFFTAIKAIVNPSDKMTNYGKFAAIARGFSDLTGIPVYAVQRDAVAIYNVLAKDVANGLTGADLPVLQKTSKYTKAQQAKLDVYEGVVTDVYENAVNSGDYKQAIENAVEQGSTYESIKSGLKGNTQDIYVRLLKTDPSEATKMKNRLAQMYAYLAEKTDTYKDKTNAEKVEIYKKNIDKWKEDWEEKQSEEQK